MRRGNTYPAAYGHPRDALPDAAACVRRFQVQLSTHAFFQCDVHTFTVPSATADGAAVTTATLADETMRGRCVDRRRRYGSCWAG